MDERVYRAVWRFNAAGIMPTAADIASRAFGLAYVVDDLIDRSVKALVGQGRLDEAQVFEDDEQLTVFAARAIRPKSQLGQGLSSALQSVASHGSTSYGPLTAARLEAVLKGAVPSDPERIRVHQGLSETPLARLLELAAEIGLSVQDLDARARDLFGESLEELTAWQPGRN
ncbi:hypothetical protein [Microvirga puerhi]|uniref:Uncharacterized protein n=1 Tax=Microvirga puerhi TaxID=2876078 RepID=A0ABS7VTQ3_9HYPH|nr:hypothetical protein [Microvirga puerhi]MBZ6078935.1 hypothetical protein [Microvirga puerhi]